METKRCTYCHKLQHGYALRCSHCGQPFARKQPPASVKKVSGPSTPLASPQRAGHSFGLHPEDQPYQSDKINVQRLMEEGLEHEPEQILFPATDEAVALKVAREAQRPRSTVKADLLEPAVLTPPYIRKRAAMSARTLSLILASSCIFFLLSSSIIAFTLIGNHAAQAAAFVRALPPNVAVNGLLTLNGHSFGAHDLLDFTYDSNKTLIGLDGNPLEMHADAQGAFTVQIRVPADWLAGTHTIYTHDEARTSRVSTTVTVDAPSPVVPGLQLSTTALTYDVESGQSPADQAITLQNTGTLPLGWIGIVTTSDGGSWLKLSPAHGTLKVGSSQQVMVSVQAQQLVANTYQGEIHFGGTASMLLDVELVVANPTEVALQPASPVPPTPQLSPTPIATQAPIATITSTPALSPTATPTPMPTATPTPTPLPVPMISVQPEVLNFTASSNKNPAVQHLTVTNVGTGPLNWSIAQQAAVFMPWLSVTGSSSGTLAPNASVSITVSCTVSTASPDVNIAALIVSDSDKDTTVSTQEVFVYLTIN